MVKVRVNPYRLSCRVRVRVKPNPSSGVVEVGSWFTIAKSNMPLVRRRYRLSRVS